MTLATVRYPFQGRQRRYLIERRDGPVVLALHPTGYSAEAFAAETRFHERCGAAVIYPQGTGIVPFTSWNAGSEPPTNRAEELGIDDLGFIRDALVREGVHAMPVFAAGFSNGGRLVYHLAGDAGLIEAGASVAGVPTDPTISAPTACGLLHLHGDADTVVPFEGGGLAGHPPADEGLQRFRDVGYAVEVRMIAGGGHWWDFGIGHDTTGAILAAWGLASTGRVLDPPLQGAA